MTDPVEYDLLGYALDALEPDERQSLEIAIDREPRLQEQLAVIRRAMRILDDVPFLEPPAGLAERTCALVQREREGAEGREVAPLERQAAEKKGARESLAPAGRSWRAIDIAAALAVCVSGAALIFPLINASRASARITACANKLREIGVALTEYSEHRNGLFPEVPERGNLGVAGSYAPTLVDAGYLKPQTVVCPSSPLAEQTGFRIPTLTEVRAAKDDRLKELQRVMGGSYGYALGYRDKNGVYRSTRNLRRENFAIAADMPAEDVATCPDHRTSPNHGWSGHNVLIEGGRVVYLQTCHMDGCDDNIFLNDRDEIGAGCQVNDAVVVRSNVSP